MKDKTKGALLTEKTYKSVLKHLKKKKKYITKAGQYFQDAMYIYMADFMDNKLVPDTYHYTKLFGLWKGKGSKLDLNMTRYIHGKEWDAKFLKTWMKTNKVGETICIFEAFDMEKFFDKEGFIDTLHTMYTQVILLSQMNK